MLTFLTKRLIQLLIVLAGVLTIIFFLQRLSGDPTNLLLPIDASDEVRVEFRKQLGLDQPLLTQYLKFMGNVVTGDLGVSYRFQQPALKLVIERMPATLLLTGASLLLSLCIALPLGMCAAVFRNTWIDVVATSLSLIGQAAPVYWIGLLAILLFSVQLGLLPSMGGGSLTALILPASTLALYSAARIMRLTRSAMLDVLHQDYIRMVRAKGVGELRILIKHALRNAAVPIVTIIGLQFGGLLGGAVITETVFAWPGVGRLAINAVHQRDFPVVQAVTLVIAVFFSLINLTVDVLYAWLNPRIKLS